MGEGRNAEHSRFQFLATVRSLVAIVVTVLAVAVVVMVIVVIHRPVEMAFRSYGYVQAKDWWRVVANTTSGDAVAPSYVYGPAASVEMLFVLSAVNPSGRGGIKGSINMIHFVDTQNMTEIANFKPKMFDASASVSFDLPPHSSHRYRRWVTIWSKQELQYLYENHLYDSSGFGVMLVVDTIYTLAGHSEKNTSYYCSPVTFIRITEDLNQHEAGDVTCKTAKELGYTPNFKSTT
uniref:Uncharacterized protein n=1 Tax=Avena sativa TaxID=4498 RepID=A0ACD5V7X4_AVESA